MTEQEERAAVVAAARLWKCTPYHHDQAVLGAGVDCARIILEAFVGAGLVERFSLPRYSHDWHLHRDEERYLGEVERYLRWYDGVDTPLEDRPDYRAYPGDVLVWRVGRTYSHGAIVTEWPYVVHASFPDRMVTEVSIFGTTMAERKMRTYTYWGNAE